MNSKTVNDMKCFLYVFGLLALALPVQAASFDCAKASTKVEKFICGDAEISKLDEELSASYKTALQDEKHADSIRQAQKRWMKERNGCADVACVRHAYETRLSSLNVKQTSSDEQTPTRQYVRDNSRNGQYHFQLTRGAGTPVCDAYLERLNTTKYVKPPFCDRPEQSTISGFTPLNRLPLSPEEVHVLFPRVNKFVLIGKQGSIEEDDAYEAMLKRNGVGPSIEPVQTMEKFLLHGEMKVWRYDPPVDMDNDGMTDNIIIWQGYGLSAPLGVCGQPTDYGGFTSDGSQPQVAFVLMDSQDRLNVQKAMEIFGHPSGGYSLANGKMATGFRPIGFRISIFKYENNYYFDTFFDFWGDFQNKRKDDPKLQDTLGVFLRKNGKTQQMCEYQMSRPNTAITGSKQ